MVLAVERKSLSPDHSHQPMTRCIDCWVQTQMSCLWKGPQKYSILLIERTLFWPLLFPLPARPGNVPCSWIWYLQYQTNYFVITKPMATVRKELDQAVRIWAAWCLNSLLRSSKAMPLFCWKQMSFPLIIAAFLLQFWLILGDFFV